jgi:hypothetical protein
MHGEWFANHFLKESNEVKKTVKFIIKKARLKYGRNIFAEKEKRKKELKTFRFFTPKRPHDPPELMTPRR